MFPATPSKSLLVLIGLSIGCACGCGPSEPPGKYTQVVLITIDTLRADHLQSYGYPRLTSPFLDQLAEKGVVFTRANATVSHTAPSHASIFTGLLPLQHGVLRNGDRLSPEFPNMAQVLGHAGYQTAAFTSAVFVNRTATGFRTVDGVRRRGAKTVDQAMAWLDRLDPEQPFFLWVHLFDVHEAELTRAGTPSAYYTAIREGTSLGPDAFYDYLAELHGLPNPKADEAFPGVAWEPVQGAGNGRPATLTSRADVIASIDHYDAKIAYVDEQIERLFEAVQNVGSDGSCFWVILADHGEGLGSHGYRGHGEHIYQEQLRVPLIFYATDESLSPGRIESLVSLVDVFPTLAEILTRPPREWSTMEGVSLWPHLLGQEVADERRTIFAQRRPFLVLEDDLFTVTTPGSTSPGPTPGRCYGAW